MISTTLKQIAARFSLNTSGIAAVEFAMIAPLMITTYFGASEVGNILLADRKVTNVAAATTDLVAQAVQINNDDMSDIFNATSAIMAPYNTASVEIIVASVNIDLDGNSTVGWSDAQNASALVEDSPYALPQGTGMPGASVVVTKVRYTYTSPIGEFLTSGLTVEDTFYQRPRRVLRVMRVD